MVVSEETLSDQLLDVKNLIHICHYDNIITTIQKILKNYDHYQKKYMLKLNKYKKPIKKLRELYIDDIFQVQPTYIGKSYKLYFSSPKVIKEILYGCPNNYLRINDIIKTKNFMITNSLVNSDPSPGKLKHLNLLIGKNRYYFEENNHFSINFTNVINYSPTQIILKVTYGGHDITNMFIQELLSNKCISVNNNLLGYDPQYGQIKILQIHTKSESILLTEGCQMKIKWT